MAHLYELTKEIDQLNEVLQGIEDDGLNVDLNLVAMRIEELGLEADAKLTACWRWIKNLESDAEQLKAEKLRIAARQQALQNRAERVKDYVAYCLGEGRKWTQPGGVAAFSWRKSEAVQVQDEALIPDCYCKLERTPVLSLIKQDIKQGATVPGAVVEERVNLQVK